MSMERVEAGDVAEMDGRDIRDIAAPLISEGIMSPPKNTTIHHDDLTEFQKDKIQELRQRLKDDIKRYPEYDTDFSLLRWLDGWDYDIDAIIPKARWALSVFDNLGFNNLRIESVNDIHQYVIDHNAAVEYFPGGILGQDKDGNVIYCQPMAKAHPRSLIKIDSTSQLFLMQLAMIEGAFKLCRAYEEKHKRKCGMKIIMDLDGFSYTEHMYMPAIKEYMKLLTLVQQVFPDFLIKLWVVNPPTSITVLYNLVKPVLSKQTVDKIEICGKDWKKILTDSCGAEHLYPAWGGTKPSDTPYGCIMLGGKVPESLWYSPATFPFDDQDKMSATTISARSKHEVRFHAKKGDIIRWIFRISNGDIDFSIHHNGEEVYPVFRLTTEFVPEKGRMRARYTGEYVAIFDNSHAKLWSKEIKHRIEAQSE